MRSILFALLVANAAASNVAATGKGLYGVKRTVLPNAFVRNKRILPDHNKKLDSPSVTQRIPRGGVSDSDANFLSKAAASAALEVAALMVVVAAGRALLTSIPESTAIPSFLQKAVSRTRLPQLLSFILLIFSSSIVGTLIDKVLSSALNQILDPNAVPGDREPVPSSMATSGIYVSHYTYETDTIGPHDLIVEVN